MQRHSRAWCHWVTVALEMRLASVTSRSRAGQQGAAQLIGWLCGFLVVQTLGPRGRGRSLVILAAVALGLNQAEQGVSRSWQLRGSGPLAGQRGRSRARQFLTLPAEGHFRLDQGPRRVRAPAAGRRTLRPRGSSCSEGSGTRTAKPCSPGFSR